MNNQDKSQIGASKRERQEQHREKTSRGDNVRCDEWMACAVEVSCCLCVCMCVSKRSGRLQNETSVIVEGEWNVPSGVE